MRTRMSGRGAHPKVRASSFRFWTFDDADDSTVRELIGGLDFNQVGTEDIPGHIASPVGTRARTFNYQNPLAEGLATANASADSTTIQGEWTIQIWMRMNGSFSNVQTILALGGDPDSALEAHNQQMLLQVTGNVSPRLIAESGAGSAQSVPLQAYDYVIGQWVHFTIRKTLPDAQADYDWIVNGEIVETDINRTNPTGGTDSAVRWKVGANYNAAVFDASSEGSVDIASVHVYNEALSIDEIKSDFRRGYLLDHFTHVDLRVEAEDANGDRRDLTNLDGVDFVNTASVTEAVDNAVNTAQVTLLREQVDLSLAHLRESSKLNLTDVDTVSSYDPIIDVNREIEIFAARVPIGIRASGIDWQSRFKGLIDSVDWGGETVAIKARDDGAQLVDTYIEEEVLNTTILADTPIEKAASYGAVAGDALQNVIQDILDDNDNSTGNNTVTGLVARSGSYDPITLVVDGTPNWSLLPYRQRREPVMSAIRTLAGQIGWECNFAFSQGLAPGGDAWELTLREPQRDRVDSDLLLTQEEVDSITAMAIDIKNIRNVVRIVYPSSEATTPTAPTITGYTVRTGWVGLDGQGNRLPAYIELENTASVTAYGRRFMEIGEASSSQIDTIDEAERFAFAAAEDLREPDLEKTATLDCMFEIELNDLVRFEVIKELYSVIQKLAVVGITHNFGAKTSTQLSLRGKPATGFKRWLGLESRPGMGRPPVADPRLALSDSDSGALLRVLRELVDKSDFGNGGKYLTIKNQDFQYFSAGTENPPDFWRMATGVWPTDVSANSTTTRTGGFSIEFNTSAASLRSGKIHIESDADQCPSYSFELQWRRNAAVQKAPSLTAVWLDGSGSEIYRTLMTAGGSTTTSEVTFDTITDVDDVGNDITLSTFDIRLDNGDGVLYFKDGGTDAIGLTDEGQYYVRQVSGDDFSIHPTREDAVDNTGAISLTDGSTGETHRFVKQPDFGPVPSTANEWFNSRVDGLQPPAGARFVELIIAADQESGAADIFIDKVAGYRTSRAALTLVDGDEISYGAGGAFSSGSTWENIPFGAKRNTNVSDFYGYDRGCSMGIDETNGGAGWHYLAREPGTHDVDTTVWYIVSGGSSGSKTTLINLVKNGTYDTNGVRTGGTVIASDTWTETYTSTPSKPLRLSHTIDLAQGDTLTVDLQYSAGNGTMTAAVGSSDEPTQFGVRLRGVD